MPLAGQLVHHRSVHPGPLVLGAAPLKSPTPVLDRDRTVSRRSEPSSRTALMGEQPNPWDVLPPQDATSRHRAISVVTDGADYLSTLPTLSWERGRRLIAAAVLPAGPDRYLTAPRLARSRSVVTGSCWKLVVELQLEVRLNELSESADTAHSDPYPKVGLCLDSAKRRCRTAASADFRQTSHGIVLGPPLTGAEESTVISRN